MSIVRGTVILHVINQIHELLRQLVTKKGPLDPIGIVIERDILYRVLVQDKDPSATSLRRIMNYPLVYAESCQGIDLADVELPKVGPANEIMCHL